MRTALEQELGLAAYFVSNDIPLEKGPKNEALESDGEKLSSTDEDEEAGTEGEGGLTVPRRLPHNSLGHPLSDSILIRFGFCLSPCSVILGGVGTWEFLLVLL